MTPFRLLVTLIALGLGAVAGVFILYEPEREPHIPKITAPKLEPLAPVTPSKVPPAEKGAQETAPIPQNPDTSSKTGAESAANQAVDAGLTMKVYLPKDAVPHDGFMVLTPREWRADQDAVFNPLLAKYKAPWAASLRKRHPDTLVIEGLPLGSYQLLIYRNDGNEHRAPTRVHAVDISSGGFCNIDAAVLLQLTPLK